MQKKSRLPGAAINLALVAAALLLGLVLAEALIRLVRPAPLFHNLDISSFGATYVLSPNPRLMYEPKPLTGEFNAYGHRGRAFPVEKPEGIKRAVLVGDSVTEGFRVSVGARFSDLLNRNQPENYEFVNLAVRGYDLAQEAAYLKEKALAFSPDMVLWGITFNDLTTNSGEIENLSRMLEKTREGGLLARYYSAKTGLERLSFRSHLFRTLWLAFARSPDKDFSENIKRSLSGAEVKSLLEEARELSRNKQFPIVFVFLPVNTRHGEKDMARLRALVEEAGFSSLDLDAFLNTRLSPERKAELFFPRDPCHLNPSGHQLVAELLKASLGMLSEEGNPSSH